MLLLAAAYLVSVVAAKLLASGIISDYLPWSKIVFSVAATVVYIVVFFVTMHITHNNKRCNEIHFLIASMQLVGILLAGISLFVPLGEFVFWYWVVVFVPYSGIPVLMLVMSIWLPPLLWGICCIAMFWMAAAHLREWKVIK